MLSIGRAIDVVTRDADEYVAWWTDSGRRVIAAIDTGTSILSSKVTISSSSSAGTPKPVPLHHPAFRFFRLSQVAEDLFDAFRNMYLAFELFLSCRYPNTKPRQPEIVWLRESLLAASVDIVLEDLVPTQHASPVDFVLDVIYGHARLPLFHAKNGKTYFVPSTERTDRVPVQAALTTLTHIVTRMAASWHQMPRPRTSFSDEALDAMAKVALPNALFVAAVGPGRAPNDPTASPSTPSGISFPAQFSDTFEGEKRAHIWGAVDTAALKGIGRVEMLYLVNTESWLTSQAFQAPLDLDGFDLFQAIQFSRILGAGEPRIFYPR
jgi:hypothetical protein